MIQVLSDDEFEQLLKQRYMQLEKNCKLSPNASYYQYIEWFVKRFDIYYQKYWLAFHLLLQNRGFPYTTCKIREDIEYMLKQKRKKSFYEIFIMEPTARMKKIDTMNGTKFEKFLQWFFTQQGYIVKKTKKRHQQGTDFILIQRNIRIAVEVKR